MLVKRLGLQINKKEASTIKFGNNQTATPIGESNITLKFGNKIITHPFLVMDTLIFPCFIGSDFIIQHGLEISLHNQQVYFHDKPDDVFAIRMYKGKKAVLQTVLSPVITKEDSQTVDKPQENLSTNNEIEAAVQSLLQKFPTVYRTDGKIGKTNCTVHKIEYEGPPIATRPYQYSPAMRAIIEENITDLLKHGLIRRSRSPYSAPIVLDQKKNGKWRMCINYKKLNAKTKTNAAPMQDCTSLLRKIPPGWWYTVIDCNSGFWQIPLDELSIEKSAFSSESGHYEFLVMPFGLKNAPKTFQHFMNIILHGLNNIGVLMDDIIIYTPNIKQHLQEVEAVLERLKEANMSISIEKSKFARRSVNYLGHVLTPTGLNKDPTKIEAVLNFPTPTKVKDIQRFHGMCQWYANFIPNFADKAEPLYRLLKANVKWQWGDEQQKAFEQLKESMAADVTLFNLDYRQEIIMKCDASEVGVGAVLVQRDSNGVDRPVAFASKTFNQHQRSAHIYEKELFAIIWAYNKFRKEIQGHPFKIQTDNRAINFLRRMKDKKDKIRRWAIKIDSWNAEIVLRPGKENVEADALSRAPLPTEPDDELFDNPPDDIMYTPIFGAIIWSDFADKVKTEQSRDSELSGILRELQDNPESDLSQFYSIEDGILKRKINYYSNKLLKSAETQEVGASADAKVDGEHINTQSSSVTSQGEYQNVGNANCLISIQIVESNECLATRCDGEAISAAIIPSGGQQCAPKPSRRKFCRKILTYTVPVVPKSLVSDILYAFHDTPEAGHFGVNKTMDRIKQRCFWTGMNKDIRTYIKSCKICQQTNYANMLPYGLYETISPPTKVFETICVDFMGPFVRSSKGNQHLFVVVDQLSKWVEIVPFRSANSRKVVEVLEDHIFCRYGPPKYLVSDNGAQFKSKLFKLMCQQWGITHRLTSPYHPQINLAERVNRNLKKMICSFVSDNHKSWDNYLQKFAFALRSTINDSTQVSPALLNLGREIPLPFDRSLQHDNSKPSPVPGEIVEKLKGIIEFVRTNIANMQHKNELEYNKKHRSSNFVEGDMVMIRNHTLSNASEDRMQKLLPRWIGPYRLGQQLTKVSFRIHSLPDGKLIGKRHVTDLKPFMNKGVQGSSSAPLVSPENISVEPYQHPRKESLRKKRRVNYRTLQGYS